VNKVYDDDKSHFTGTTEVSEEELKY